MIRGYYHVGPSYDNGDPATVGKRHELLKYDNEEVALEHWNEGIVSVVDWVDGRLGCVMY
jgi:hypothetical protein